MREIANRIDFEVQDLPKEFWIGKALQIIDSIDSGEKDEVNSTLEGTLSRVLLDVVLIPHTSVSPYVRKMVC